MSGNRSRKICKRYKCGTLKDIRPAGIDWYRVARGCVLSAGQVYGVRTLPGSVVILVGLAIYSPLLSLASFIGGAIGTVSAVYFGALSRYSVSKLE